jgi:O-antigen/teichoic acid export membrane protein
VEIERPTRFGTVKYVVLAISLLVFALVLGSMTVYAARKIHEADEATRKYVYYLAWTSLLLLGLVIVALIWIIARFLGYRARPSKSKSATPYVDAWSLAGKRFKLKDADDSGGDSPTEPPAQGEG